MRILMLSRDPAGLDPKSSTSSRWRLLRDRGVELDVLVASHDMGSWQEAGMTVTGTGGSSALVRLWRLKRLAMRHAATANLVTAQDPFELGLIAWRVSKHRHKPFEIQDHGGFFDGKPADEPFWPWRLRLARWLARRADAIRTVSPGSLDELTKSGLGAKTYFLPIAADNRFRSIQWQPETDFIVTVSRLIHVKRNGLLLKSFVALKRLRPAAKLAVVGDGPERQDLEEFARQLGIAADVQFVGAADPAPWLSRAALFVSLSSHEGWGIASVEAALAGVPVVMSDTGCARWLAARDAATIASTDEPEQIAETMAAALGKIVHARVTDALAPEASAIAQVTAWNQLKQRDAKGLLVIAQAVDEDDPLFGFFVPWLAEASRIFPQVTVFALRAGRFALPSNVHVMPLRPGASRSRASVLWNLWRLSYQQRTHYRSVFVRGDAQYVVLAGWLWRMMGKRTVLWYAHYTSQTPWLKPASWFANAVVTSVRAACALPDAVPIGQGVDASRFSQTHEHRVGPTALLIFSRVSPVKRIPWMLERVSEASSATAHRITVYGTATKTEEATRLQHIAAKTGAHWDAHDVPNADAPELYRSHDVYLNATPGSLDKTIVEAMLSGLVVVASTPGYGEMLPADLAWLCPADDAFGAAAVRAAGLSVEDRQAIGLRLRDLALSRHSQTQQIRKLKEML